MALIEPAGNGMMMCSKHKCLILEDSACHLCLLDDGRHHEWHVTVAGDTLGWVRFCDEHGIKPLLIELSNRNVQHMCAINYDPNVVQVDPRPGMERTLMESIVKAGFVVRRVKHEVDRLLEDERSLYFETHVKLDGAFRPDLKGASRDLLRCLGDTEGRWYLTKRDTLAFDVERFIRSVRIHVQGRGSASVIAEAGSEYCLQDTNPQLDRGWL